MINMAAVRKKYRVNVRIDKALFSGQYEYTSPEQKLNQVSL